MKYTKWLKYQLGIFAFLFLISNNLIAQTSQDNSEEQVFSNQLDLIIDAKSIEITLELTTKSANEKLAREEHLDFINQLRSQMLDISASVTSSDEKDIAVRQPNFARLQFAKPEAKSEFIVSVTSDRQLSSAVSIIRKTKGAEIKDYIVVYDSIRTDDELTTDLTNQILEDIRQSSKETGKALTPRGFTQLDIETLEIGREQLDRVLDGKSIEAWNKSDQKISLIKTTKKISIGLKAS